MSSSLSVRELLHWVIGAVCLSLLVRTWMVMGLIVPVRVAGNSMEPSLVEGDGVLVDRTAYLFQDPTHGDIVVFRCPHHPNEFCVKRIVGLPGEAIQLGGGRLQVDGKLLASGPQFALRYQDLGDVQTSGWAKGTRVWQLGGDEFFVMGDNTAISEDSRSWPGSSGLSRKFLLGKALRLQAADFGSALNCENSPK